MNIHRWKRERDNGGPGQMVRVTRNEALRLITSLSEQLRSREPNGGREEFQTDKGEYFSISVIDY